MTKYETENLSDLYTIQSNCLMTKEARQKVEAFLDYIANKLNELEVLKKTTAAKAVEEDNLKTIDLTKKGKEAII